ncbi:MAG TPA: hypothetical protein VFL86_00370 [Burkholderiaceae bacterium]|nr:hypothetical protein [Burkholderiaceae bacterium]
MNKHPLICAGILALLSLPALGARPMQTDDAGVLERADCELEGSSLRQLADGERSTQSGLQLGCGIGGKTQVALAAATANDAGMHHSGLALLGKHGLWQAAPGDGPGAALALSWQIAEARTPGGSWHHEGSELRLIGSQPLDEDVTLHANIGHAHNVEDRMHSTSWGVALEHAPLSALAGLAPMAEVFGDDRDPVWWNLGLRYSVIAEKLCVDASYGRQAGRSLLTVGFKLAF